MIITGAQSQEVRGLVDCDSFYASCETYLHPEYAHRAVCVGGDIVIARNYIAREYGITVGMPVWEAVKRLPESAVFCKPQMAEYGRISQRIIYRLNEVCNDVQEYSIDESFINVTGLAKRYNLSYKDIARKMKIQIRRDIGIPVSIGLGPTRILAKIFADAYKPYGDYVGLTQNKIDYVLEQLPLRDIPYIGKQSAAKIQYTCANALDFKQMDGLEVRKKLGGSGFKIWCELQGVSARSPSTNSQPYSITRSRSFNPDFTSDPDVLWSHLYRNIEKAHEHLMDVGCVTQSIGIHMRDKDFGVIRDEITLPQPTNDKVLITQTVRSLFEQLSWDVLYRTTGVIFGSLSKHNTQPVSLFATHTDGIEETSIIYQDSQTKSSLNDIMYQLNKKFGRGTIQVGLAHTRDRLQPRYFPVAFEVH